MRQAFICTHSLELFDRCPPRFEFASAGGCCGVEVTLCWFCLQVLTGAEPLSWGCECHVPCNVVDVQTW